MQCRSLYLPTKVVLAFVTHNAFQDISIVSQRNRNYVLNGIERAFAPTEQADWLSLSSHAIYLIRQIRKRSRQTAEVRLL